MEQGFEYYAFISYKSEDEKWAKWLQSKIEHYRLPAIIRKSNADIPNKVRPVFFAKSDIQPGPLESGLQRDLERSKYLIVICSPRSANSNWVGKEIQYFISIGRANKIILFAIDGIPYSNDRETECIHPVIKKELPELYAVNINEEGNEWQYTKNERAFIQVLSKILNVSFDTFWRRHRKRKIKQMSLIVVCAFSILAVIAGTWKYSQPLDIQLYINEMTFHNEYLGFPSEGGLISIIYNNKDTLTKTVKGLNDIISFNDIPGYYSGTKSKVLFHLWGFENVDTVMELKHSMVLPIRRDDSYAYVNGHVYDFKTGENIHDATVIINNSHTTFTDSNGCFQFHLPLHLQREFGNIIIHKTGYEKYEDFDTHIETSRDSYAEYCLFKK